MNTRAKRRTAASRQPVLYAGVRPPDCRRRSRYAPLPRRSIARNNAAISGSVGVGIGTVTVFGRGLTWDRISHHRSSRVVAASDGTKHERVLTGIRFDHLRACARDIFPIRLTICLRFIRVFILRDGSVGLHVGPGERDSSRNGVGGKVRRGGWRTVRVPHGVTRFYITTGLQVPLSVSGASIHSAGRHLKPPFPQVSCQVGEGLRTKRRAQAKRTTRIMVFTAPSVL